MNNNSLQAYDKAKVFMPSHKQIITHILMDSGIPLTPKEIANISGLKEASVFRRMRALCEEVTDKRNYPLVILAGSTKDPKNGTTLSSYCFNFEQKKAPNKGVLSKKDEKLLREFLNYLQGSECNADEIIENYKSTLK